MSPAVLVPAIVSIVAGIAVGCIPVVNEHLHWYMAGIIPITGFLLGMALAFLQFQIAFRLDLKVTTAVRAILATAAAVALLGTDLGIYLTTTVSLKGVEGLPDGEYKIRELMSFPTYMHRFRLHSLSIQSRHGGGDTEFGSTTTRVLYGLDLLFCFGMTFLLLGTSAEGAPFCDACSQYKKKAGELEVPVPDDPEGRTRTIAALQAAAAGDYKGLAAFLNQGAMSGKPGAAGMKITAEERVCDSCMEATILGKVMATNPKGQWVALEGQGFRMDSPGGTGGQLQGDV